MNKLILLFLIVFFANNSIFSEKLREESSWVYLKRTENSKEKGKYAQAVVDARKAKEIHAKEQLDKYFYEIRDKEKEKADYEIRKIIESKRNELMQKDNYSEYHELMGDLFILTSFLPEAEQEYKKAIDQKKYFEYPKKLIEIKYKLCNVYEKEQDYETADIIYREIVEPYLKLKTPDFWTKLRDYVKQDTSLSRIFRLYREDGIEYFKAFCKL